MEARIYDSVGGIYTVIVYVQGSIPPSTGASLLESAAENSKFD